MGREIRRVPANWEHPKDKNGNYQPLYDNDFNTAADKWDSGYELWKTGEAPEQLRNPRLKELRYWGYWGPPPKRDYYHPKWDNADWYQVYETVSEGTPVTPPFATKEELINYLVDNGDFWDQRRGDGGWDRRNAESFVTDEWTPSLIVFNSPGKTIIHAPRDGQIEES